MEQIFVLKLMRELNTKTGSAQGHVEDVRTGKACRFHSISELLAFLEQTVNGKETRDENC
jgi:oligoribonuclease (3'-5' exoribonuclease)